MEDIVARRARDGGAWLEPAARSAGDVRWFMSAFADASRSTGRSALGLTPEEVVRLREVGVRWSLARWALDDFARATLLVRAGDTLDAARADSAPLFEAIACDNPYPNSHFPTLNFDQMVMRALVGGVALDRIVGLGARVTPALVRMANDYAAERRAAGRSVPADLGYITAAMRIAAA